MADPAAVLAIMVTANTKQAQAALAKTQGQLTATGKTATATSATVKKAMLGIGLAAGAAGVALFKVGEEFDDAFDKIQTRTGATGREMRKLRGVFRDVVSDVPASFDDAATAVGDLNTRLGLSGKPLKQMAKQVTELSRITDTDLEGNVRSVARAFVDWEVATKDQSDALDGFFRLSQKSGVSVAEIADSIQKFGSPLRNLGFDLEESAAMFANFERAGVNTRTMVPGLKLAIANLVDPTSDLADTFEKLGVNARKPEDGIRQVFSLLSGDNLNQVEKMSLAMEVFGSRAGADMAEAIRQGRFEVDKFINVMRNGEGTIREQGRRTMDLSEQWTIFKNNLKLAVEPVATKFFKGLGDLMKEVTATFKKEGLSGVLDLLLQKLSDAVPKVLAFGGKVAEALVRGFLKAGVWGHLALGAVVFKMLGGLMAPAVAAGTTMAQRFGAGVKAGLARAGIAGVVVGVFEALTTEGGVIDTIEGEGNTIGKNFAAAVGGGLGPELAGAIDKHSIPALRRLSAQTRDMVKVFERAGEDVPDEVRQMANQSGRAYDNLIDKQTDVKRSIHELKVGFHGNLGDIMRDTEQTMTAIEGSFGRHSKRGKELLAHNFEAAIQAIERAIDTGQVKANKGLDMINDLIRKRLAVYGIKGADAEKIIKAQSGEPTGLQKGGVIHAAMGTMVPGYGTGDKVPAMLEPGEVVLNRKAVAALGGANKANAVNAMIPRFASGGVIQQALGPYSIPPITYDPNHAGGNSHLHLDFFSAAQTIAFGKKMQQMGWSIGEYSGSYPGFGPVTTQHQSPGHYDGTAFDANTASDETRAEVAAVARLLSGGGASLAAAVKKLSLKLPRFDAGFPYYAPAAAGMNNLASGLERIISERVNARAAKMQTTGVDGAGTYKGPLNKVFPHPTTVANPGIALAARDVAMLASKAGLNGDTFEKISRGESGHHPGIVGYDPGGTRGLGLWQITTGYNDDIIKRFGGETQMFNPWVNAQAAKAIFDRQGIGAWYGTQFLAKGGKVKGWGGPGFFPGIGSQGPVKPGQGSQPSGYAPTISLGVPPNASLLPKNISDALFWLSANVEHLEEQIANAETLAGFFTSEFGSDLGPTERAQQIDLNSRLLTSLLETVPWLERALGISTLAPDTRSELRTSLNTIRGVTGQGGKILTVRSKLDQLKAPEASTTIDNRDEIISLLQANLLSSQRALAVSQAQYGVFAGMRGAGGKIGAGQWAIAGESGPEVVTGPAHVYSNRDSFGAANVRVVIQDQRTRVFIDDQEVRAIVKDETRQMARGRPLPGVRG